MHNSVLTWVALSVGEFDVAGQRVLEVGSYNVNGTVRPLIERYSPQRYLGVDASAGPNVDEVVECGQLVDHFGESSWNMVISTEMLEHVRDWKDCLENLIKVVAEDGLLVITTRSPGFPYHPFPEDHWRYPLRTMGKIIDASRLKIELIDNDPQCAGVFVIARKPPEWKWPTDPWAGIELPGVDGRVKMVESKPAEKPDTAKSADKPAAKSKDTADASDNYGHMEDGNWVPYMPPPQHEDAQMARRAEKTEAARKASIGE